MIKSRDRTIVVVDGRTFTVAYGIDNVPLRITERKKVTNFGVDYEYNYPYWHRTHALGGSTTLPVRILAAAAEKRKKQDEDPPRNPFSWEAKEK